MFINTGWFYKIWYTHTMKYKEATGKYEDSLWDDKKSPGEGTVLITAQ